VCSAFGSKHQNKAPMLTLVLQHDWRPYVELHLWPVFCFPQMAFVQGLHSAKT
jgi:hypothetical protein